MTTASRTRPATDAFLPSGAYDYNLNLPHQQQLQKQQQLHNPHLPQDHRLSSSSSFSFSSNRPPPPNHAPTNGSNDNGNFSSILSPSQPPPSGFPPSGLPLPLPNESAVLSPPSYSSVSAAVHQPLPLSKYHQQRFRSSLSPIKQNRPATTQPGAPQRTDIPEVNGAAFLYRSVSADATSAAGNAPNQLVQRLAQQNTLIREAWEAERNYLEANRRRAEEVYQEERVIMEEVREAWENEKAVLLRENQVLKERIQRLEGENATLRSIASQGVQAPGVMSPLASQRCDSTAASDSGSGTSGPSASQAQVQQPIAPVADPSSLPPGLDGAARRPHHIISPNRHSPGNSRLSSPTKQPESSPFIPLDPRIQPQNPNPRDFLHAKESEESVPVIDVQEVDPQLDGIQLKATAVQQFTFGKSDQTSPSTSPPAAEKTPPERMGLQKRLSSKDHTIQVLKAEESRRLTMHAGHTPNHSLSLFPTMSVAGASTANTHDDDTTAPSEGAPSPVPPEEPVEEKQVEQPEQLSDDKFHEAEAPKPADLVEHEPEDPFEIMEPAEDRRMKGPLMIKNIPAQDEIFWDQVNKKLEPISQGQDALPTVMRRASEEEAIAGPSGTKVVHAANAAVAPVGGDASHDPQSTEGEGSGQKPVEPDVPLKLKTTTNFGAPFGMA